MTKYVVCAVRDQVADLYNVPFSGQSLGSVVRNFTDEVNRPAEDNLLYRHADDYELFQLGTFDDSNARFELLPEPKSLMLGRDAKAVAAPQKLREVK